MRLKTRDHSRALTMARYLVASTIAKAHQRVKLDPLCRDPGVRASWGRLR